MKTKKIKLVCPNCQSEEIEIDVITSAIFTLEKINGNYWRGFEDRGGELNMSGEPYCIDCGEEFNVRKFEELLNKKEN